MCLSWSNPKDMHHMCVTGTLSLFNAPLCEGVIIYDYIKTKLGMCSQTEAHLHIKRAQNNLSIHSVFCFWSVFTQLLAVFGSPGSWVGVGGIKGGELNAALCSTAEQVAHSRFSESSMKAAAL